MGGVREGGGHVQAVVAERGGSIRCSGYLLVSGCMGRGCVGWLFVAGRFGSDLARIDVLTSYYK